MGKNLLLILQKHRGFKNSILRFSSPMKASILPGLKRPWRHLTPRGFWRKVTPTETCWLWQGFMSPKGFPLYSYYWRKKAYPVPVRQLMWAWLERDASPNLTPSCGNPRCIHPTHLEVGRRKGRRGPHAKPSKDAIPESLQPVSWGKYGVQEYLALSPRPEAPLGAGLPLRPTVFWRYVRVGQGDCWNWLGPVTTQGWGLHRWYDQEIFRMKSALAHRLALKWSGLELAAVKKVYRVCRNQRCVNPEHLLAGVGTPYKRRKRGKSKVIQRKQVVGREGGEGGEVDDGGVCD